MRYPSAIRKSVWVLVCLTAVAVGAACNRMSQPADPAPDPEAMAAAMAPQPESVSRVHLIRVKPGMDAQFINGARAHMEWHRKMKDAFPWTAFYVETGPDTGMYGWITQGRTWAEFDAYDATIGVGDGENVGQTMGPFVQEHQSGFSVGFPNFSNPAAPGTTFPLVHVDHYTVHPTKQMDFLVAISRAHTALQAGGFAPNYAWSMQVAGNDGVVFNLVRPLSKWADMSDDPAFMRIMNEQLGEEGAQALIRNFNASLVTGRTWIARILPDLSYTPGS